MRRLLALAGLLAGFCCSGLAWGQAVKVINSLPDFEQFWSEAQGKPFEEQERLWTSFEAKYPDIYERIVFPRSDPNWRQRRLDKLRTTFARLPALAPRIIALMRGADSTAEHAAERFRQDFPDLEPGTPVVFIPIATFNAAVRPPEVLPRYGRYTLVLGADFIIDNHDVLDVDFAHEFFHVYHFGKLRDRPNGSTMAAPLWVEGFATYVSAAMNPSAAPASIFMDAELASACTPANVARWSKQYLHIAGQGADSPELQSAWFRIVSATRPRRRGYCVGYHVARVLAASNKLSDMAGWDETVYQAQVASALRTLAGPDPMMAR
jgi:hypothetical protein